MLRSLGRPRFSIFPDGPAEFSAPATFGNFILSQLACSVVNIAFITNGTRLMRESLEAREGANIASAEGPEEGSTALNCTPCVRNRMSTMVHGATADACALAEVPLRDEKLNYRSAIGESAAMSGDKSHAPSSFLTGWRLHVLNFSLCLGLFLSALDSSIVSTSIISITDDLQEFSRSSWIISAYLLTYTSFLVPLAKISDIYGRRPVLTLVTVIFVAFSAGAGWSRTMIQLCVFRAFQGLGGGGLYGLTFVILPEMVAPQQYALYSAITSSLFTLSSLLGPLAGGAISNHNEDWRWIFWLNVPAGVVALVLSWLALPPGFPHHKLKHRPNRNFSRFDMIGAFLILAASVLFVAGLETGGTQYAWFRATPISLVCVGLLCWLLLGFWVWSQDRRAAQQEPILPWRVLSNRFAIGALLNAFFVGAAFIPAIIQLPQRFQIVDRSSSLAAGCRLLALTLGSPIGSASAGILMQRLKLPAVYILMLGTLVQVFGLGLYTGLDAGVTNGAAREQYAFMVIMGIGFGLSLAVVVMSAPLIFEPRDMAVGIGAISQLRVLGGSVGVSGCASILNRQLSSDLRGIVSPAQLAKMQSSVAVLDQLPTATAQAFRDSYARGTRQEMYLITAMAAASILATLFMVERKPRRMG